MGIKVATSFRKVFQDRQFEPAEFIVTVETDVPPEMTIEGVLAINRGICIDEVEQCFDEWQHRLEEVRAAMVPDPRWPTKG
jgi:hypothetical protein